MSEISYLFGQGSFIFVSEKTGNFKMSVVTMKQIAV